jgi:hypothetical protein
MQDTPTADAHHLRTEGAQRQEKQGKAQTANHVFTTFHQAWQGLSADSWIPPRYILFMAIFFSISSSVLGIEFVKGKMARHPETYHLSLCRRQNKGELLAC